MSKYTKDADAISRLSREQFRVTLQNGTERPCPNGYWDHDEPGTNVDIVSGEPLFSSNDKFDNDCGSPSFTNSWSFIAPARRRGLLTHREVSVALDAAQCPAVG
jgi:peptide methionine sulfoxide reductase MsrB